MRTLLEIADQFPTAAEKGLTSDQAIQSGQRFGSNRLTPLPRPPIWKKFLDKFDEPIIKILLAAALLSMVVDLFAPPADRTRYVAGSVALAALALSLAAAFLGQRTWLPSLLFLSALVFFGIAASTGHSWLDGLAVMGAVLMATAVAHVG